MDSRPERSDEIPVRSVSAYQDFISAKRRNVTPVGPHCTPDHCNPILHSWQRQIVAWAVTTGRAAIFADCGLGKTFMQLEWARLIGDTVIIVAPLSVARQTCREANKIGIDVQYVRHQDEVTGPGIWITNYEMVTHFNPDTFDAVVLDESSILKNVDGTTRKFLTDKFSTVKYRLACTATPAPNDVSELCNHAEFLGAMPRNEMLAAYFVHDDDGWRPKRHATNTMYQWMSSWAVALRRPSDAGYDDTGYDLPALSIIPQIVKVTVASEGQLFATELGGVGGRAKIRRETLNARVARVVEVVNTEADAWVVWCGLNGEQDALAKAFGDRAISIHGSLTPDEKEERLIAWLDGEYEILLSKPSISGFGLNLQRAHNMVFVGLSDSWESYYQAIRRCWRFGQQHPVNAHIVLSELEQQIAHNIQRKERDAIHTSDRLIDFSPIKKDRQ